MVLISCLHFQFGSTLKEKNLLLEEQILSFSSISSPELFDWSGKYTDRQNYCLALTNVGNKTQHLSIHLNMFIHC